MATDDTRGLQPAPKRRSFLERIGLGAAPAPKPAGKPARKARRYLQKDNFDVPKRHEGPKPRKAPASKIEPRYQDLDPDSLQAVIRKDRIRRRMTWPVYAKFLGVHLSTLHKIATGVHRPSELTEAVIREALAKNP
jgi:hypothetical protein